MIGQKKILVAPLNWGLGHATRCIPIIKELQKQGAEVILASDGIAYDLLKREFPDLMIHQLPVYNILYPFRSMMLSMAIQLPKILRGAISEHFWLKKFLKNTPVDAVISDNRFGFFSRRSYSIFMTHQVNILIPFPFFEPMVNAVNHFFIKRFDACWIPDFEGTPNLAGVLSHGKNIKKLNFRYLGALSRFSNFPVEKKYRAAIVLSGPEPQRSILEKKLRQQLIDYSDTNGQYLLVRGTRNTEGGDTVQIPNLETHNLLTSDQLNQKIMESEVVICRSGYSSVMDLASLHIAAILIPTPGQTEQEYLARELMQQKEFFSQTQDEFELQIALKEYKNYKNCINSSKKNETLKEIIYELLKF